MTPNSCFRGLAAAALLAGSAEARAVSPLVVDDAGTVDARRLQLNAGWRFLRTSPETLNAVPVNPVLGVSARGEVGAAFGYERRSGGDAPGEAAADGATDVLLSTKWRLWQSEAGFQLGARFDVKLPAASEREGLGTGDTDMGGVVVVTRCWGRTCLDWNAGYFVASLSRGVAGDDVWFFGQAVRFELGRRWTLLGEIFGLVPAGDLGPPSEVRFNGGPQYAVRENFLLSALIGSAAGRGSPDLTSYVGLTWVF